MNIEEEILGLETKIRNLKLRIPAHSVKPEIIQELDELEEQLEAKKKAKFSFKGFSIVSCSTLRMELNYLKESGFLNVDKILYTVPGLHENPQELERQLKRQIESAKKYSQKIIVVYGSGCFIDVNDPSRSIDRLIQEQGDDIQRIDAKNCIDMLVNIEEREKIAKEQMIYWLSPGWLQNWKVIFKDWDIGKANETFPQNDKALLLDGLNFFDEYSKKYPEKILEFSDWMRLSIEYCKITLDRFKNLLLQVKNGTRKDN